MASIGATTSICTVSSQLTGSSRRPRPGKSLPRLAANLSTLFGELPFRERFAAAAAAGFRHVEYQFPYPQGTAAQVAGWARDAGVAVVLHNITAGNEAAGDRGIASLPGREQEFRHGVEQAIDYALEARCPRLNCLAGLRGAGVAPGEQLRVLVENVQHAAGALHRHGIELLLEPVALLPGFFLGDSASALRVIDAASHTNVRLQYDLFQMHLAGEELASQLQQLLPRIGHIQIADAPGRHEPGTGVIDFGRLLPLIDRLGYQGTVGCEYRPIGATVAGLRWADAWLQRQCPRS